MRNFSFCANELINNHQKWTKSNRDKEYKHEAKRSTVQNKPRDNVTTKSKNIKVRAAECILSKWKKSNEREKKNVFFCTKFKVDETNGKWQTNGKRSTQSEGCRLQHVKTIWNWRKIDREGSLQSRSSSRTKWMAATTIWNYANGKATREHIKCAFDCLSVWHIRIDMPNDDGMCACVRWRVHLAICSVHIPSFNQLKYVLMYSNIHGAGVFLYRYG